MNLEDYLPPSVWQLIERHVPEADRDSLDAQVICAHEMHGGRSKGNLGAICMDSTLAISDVRKAPQYTEDYYHRPNLQVHLSVSLLELFRYAACFCEAEREEMREAGVEKYNKLITAQSQKRRCDCNADSRTYNLLMSLALIVPARALDCDSISRRKSAGGSTVLPDRRRQSESLAFKQMSTVQRRRRRKFSKFHFMWQLTASARKAVA